MNRVGVLVVAAVVAIGSCFGLVRYASGAQDRAVSAAEPVPVMIAMKDVPQGMPFSTAWNEGRLALSNIPRTLRPATAVVDPNGLDGLTAAAPLSQGQLVVQASFTKADPNAATTLFRQVLERNPTHYGATFQHATALDRDGKPDEARPVWEKVLQMAEANNDKQTADTARAHLGQNSEVSTIPVAK